MTKFLDHIWDKKVTDRRCVDFSVCVINLSFKRKTVEKQVKRIFELKKMNINYMYQASEELGGSKTVLDYEKFTLIHL